MADYSYCFIIIISGSTYYLISFSGFKKPNSSKHTTGGKLLTDQHIFKCHHAIS